jgi:hypothetical protein
VTIFRSILLLMLTVLAFPYNSSDLVLVAAPPLPPPAPPPLVETEPCSHEPIIDFRSGFFMDVMVEEAKKAAVRDTLDGLEVKFEQFGIASSMTRTASDELKSKMLADIDNPTFEEPKESADDLKAAWKQNEYSIEHATCIALGGLVPPQSHLEIYLTNYGQEASSPGSIPWREYDKPRFVAAVEKEVIVRFLNGSDYEDKVHHVLEQMFPYHLSKTHNHLIAFAVLCEIFGKDSSAIEQERHLFPLVWDDVDRMGSTAILTKFRERYHKKYQVALQ